MQKDRDLDETLRFWATQTYSRFLRYARSVGWPYRRIRYFLLDLGRAAIFLLVIVSALLLGTLLASWTVGETAVFLSPENQAQWFVELLIIIFAGVVLHFALREKGTPAPSLILQKITGYEAKDGRRVFGVKIKNDGDYAASGCTATLEIEGIDKSEIQSRKKPSAFQGFQGVDTQGFDTRLNVDLCWDLTSKKMKTLRSDGGGELLVARWIPSERGKAEHFAIVGDRGWSSTSMRLAAEPSHYFGKVKITPLNGKAYYVSICLKKDTLIGPIMDSA